LYSKILSAFVYTGMRILLSYYYYYIVVVAAVVVVSV